jgi:hypothetical protein
MYIVASYAVYLAVSIAVTIWVARTLHHNGRVFLVDVFHGNAALGDSVNHLLVVGFIFINIGNILGNVTLAPIAANTPRQAIEMVSGKIGWILVVLGFTHFLTLHIFSRLRRRGEEPFLPPPLPPDAHVSLSE